MRVAVHTSGVVVVQVGGEIRRLSPEEADALALELSSSAREARRAEVAHNRRAAVATRKADGVGAKGPKPNDYTGKRFGKLTALYVTRKMPVHWSCRCDCGSVVEVKSHNLVNGRRRSCGCLAKRQIVSEGVKLARSSWTKMKQRCNDTTDDNYERYGARGIGYCEEWKSFKQFLADMGERPHGTTLDRIDPERGYSPGNCRWATVTTQSRNRRNVRLTEGDVAHIKKALEEKTATQKELALRFGVNAPVIQAIHAGRSWADVKAAA